jgi:hypothetical protein
MISFKLIPEDLSKSEETIDEISAHENGDEWEFKKMKEWMNERVKDWESERANEWQNERMKKWKNGNNKCEKKIGHMMPEREIELEA